MRTVSDDRRTIEIKTVPLLPTGKGLNPSEPSVQKGLSGANLPFLKVN